MNYQIHIGDAITTTENQDEHLGKQLLFYCRIGTLYLTVTFN